jgi:hypothetical protein
MSPGFHNPRFSNRQADGPDNRFESIAVEYDDGIERPQAMRVYKETAKSILSRNESPDIPFRFSVNQDMLESSLIVVRGRAAWCPSGKRLPFGGLENLCVHANLANGRKNGHRFTRRRSATGNQPTAGWRNLPLARRPDGSNSRVTLAAMIRLGATKENAPPTQQPALRHAVSQYSSIYRYQQS